MFQKVDLSVRICFLIPVTITCNDIFLMSPSGARTHDYNARKGGDGVSDAFRIVGEEKG